MPLDQAEQFPFELEHNGLVVVEETDELFTDLRAPLLRADWILVGRPLREEQPFRFQLLVSPRLRDREWTFWPLVMTEVAKYEQDDLQGWTEYEGGHYFAVRPFDIDDPFH